MITLTPYEDIKNTFIVLHDFDQTADQASKTFVPLNQKVVLPVPSKIVFLQAPSRKITFLRKAGEEAVSSWYDILFDPRKVNYRSP
jgi:hypothetical protein